MNGGFVANPVSKEIKKSVIRAARKLDRLGKKVAEQKAYLTELERQLMVAQDDLNRFESAYIIAKDAEDTLNKYHEIWLVNKNFTTAQKGTTVSEALESYGTADLEPRE